MIDSCPKLAMIISYPTSMMELCFIESNQEYYFLDLGDVTLEVITTTRRQFIGGYFSGMV